MRSSANLTLPNWTHRKVKRVQIRAPWGPFIFANECWNVGLNPALSHFVAMWRSRVLLKSPRCTIKVLTCPGKQFNFQNVRNVTLTVQFHSWGYKNEWRSPSGCDCRQILPLIHLYSELYHFGGLGIAERQISSHQWTPNCEPFRLSWDSECVDICQISYDHEWLKVQAFSAFCKYRFWGLLWGFDALKFDCFQLLQPFLQQNDVNSFSTFSSYFSPDASFRPFVFLTKKKNFLTNLQTVFRRICSIFAMQELLSPFL